MHSSTNVFHQLSALRSLIRRRRQRHDDQVITAPRDSKSLANRLADVFRRTWDLGFTAFGGPPVHFRILHQRFVEGKGGEKWVDEQTYQELFAICQALPGPGSTKMIFCLALLHAGFIPAVVTFLIWSLPGAVGMYGLSLGVQHINQTLPAPVYALLSGLNSSTVGIIALAAVQLAEKAIKDRLSRILIIFGACAGMCYNALWFFPLLMALGGLAAAIWDGWMSQRIGKLRAQLRQRRRSTPEVQAEEASVPNSIPLEERAVDSRGIQRRNASTAKSLGSVRPQPAAPRTSADAVQPQSIQTQNFSDHIIRVRVGIAIVILFFGSFIGILVGRGVQSAPPLALDLFANMYLAGTIIFGGGPVVIPLLRSYVVSPGWVSNRDFLLGLAIIQAFPGPNFNFAVYLGALALQSSPFPTVFGAFLGFLGIFLPGIALAVAVQSFWRVLRTKKWVVDILRGVNATAIGLVFTAVYRLWEIGYLTPQDASGKSLGSEPWWLVVATVTYAESAWFNTPPALAIVIGGILGLCWYGAVGRG